MSHYLDKILLKLKKILKMPNRIIIAKQMGIIQAVKPIIEKLEAVDFRISEKLKKQILDKASE